MRYFLAMPACRPGQGLKLRVKPSKQGRYWNTEDRRYRGRYKTVVASFSSLERISEMAHLGFGYRLCSLAFLDALRAAGEACFQDFPIVVRDSQGKQDRKSYRLIRLYEPVECADRQASIYDRSYCPTAHPETMLDIEELILRPESIPPDRHFFVVRGADCFAASEAFRREFLKRRLRGLIFIKHGRIKHFQQSRFGHFQIDLEEAYAQTPAPPTPIAKTVLQFEALLRSGIEFEIDPALAESLGIEEVNDWDGSAEVEGVELSAEAAIGWIKALAGQDAEEEDVEEEDVDDAFEDEDALDSAEPSDEADPSAPPWGRVVWKL
jgi:hypothetical protein